MTKHGTGQTLPTVSGWAAKQAISSLRKKSIAIAPLLRRAGLPHRAGPSEQSPPAGDGNPMRHRVSAVAQGKFLHYAAEAMDDNAFGFHLAQQTDPRDAGILFYVVSGAQNISEALTLFARYFQIVNESVRMKLMRTARGLSVEFNFVGLPRYSIQQNVELGIAVLLKTLRDVAGRKIRPTRVSFAHARISNLVEFERFFGCHVEFRRASIEGASPDLLEFSKDALAVPLVTADPKLLRALRPFCDMAAKERKTPAGTLRAAVERELERLLPHGETSAQTVAKILAVSVRTLSRRLAEEGTTYAKVVDQLRRSLALQYLKAPDISLSQIAWLLGYERTTSFNHAFKRWTGYSPSVARQDKQVSAPC